MIKAYGYTMHYLKPTTPVIIDAQHQLIATDVIKKYGEAAYQLFELRSLNKD
jgi:hypothetical protein